MTDETKTPDSDKRDTENTADVKTVVEEMLNSASDESQEKEQEKNDDTPDNTQALLEEARAKADQNYDQFVRLQAEMDNLRKRTKRDLESAHKFALEKICRELLAVRDSMEMGLQAAEIETADLGTMRQGMDLTLKMLATMMDKFEMLQVSPQKGEKLNPELHQAMSMQEDADAEPNTILTVVQKGYTLNSRLMRPAMVVVAKAMSSTAGDDDKKIGSEIDEQA
ncbi:Heat shock protein GrpE [hydrothermal vent metagenome]|uniref:Heat shock protein GrpE n=1 Tax=hydrothermal vent metagenome TaxID=652676 RepID=A0A3B0Z919_9ZZZZ